MRTTPVVALCVVLALSAPHVRAANKAVTTAQNAASTMLKLDADAAAKINKTNEARSAKLMLSSQNLMAEALQERQKRLAAETTLLGLTGGDIDFVNAPWEMFLYQLRQQIAGGDQWKGLQLLATPQVAEWDNPQTGTFQAVRVIADSLPAWGNNYLATPLQVSRGYGLFLSNIYVPQANASDQARAEAAQDRFNRQLQKIAKEDADSSDRWAAFDKRQQVLPPSRRKTYDEWYDLYERQTMQQMQQDLNSYTQDWVHWINAAQGGYGPFAQAVLAYSNTAYEVKATDPNGSTLPYKSYSITPDLGQQLADWRKLPAGTAQLSFSFDKSSGRIASSNTSWGGSASYFGFISVGASGKRESLDVHNDAFKASFSAAGFRTFTITPGQWFDATTVAAYANGPWIPGGPIATGQAHLWGDGGVLGVMPVAIVVAYKPKVAVSMSEADYNRVYSEINAGGGFSIGPFGFGGSYHHDDTEITHDDKSHTIYGEDHTDRPTIVAIVSVTPPTFK